VVAERHRHRSLFRECHALRVSRCPACGKPIRPEHCEIVTEPTLVAAILAALDYPPHPPARGPPRRRTQARPRHGSARSLLGRRHVARQGEAMEESGRQWRQKGPASAASGGDRPAARPYDEPPSAKSGRATVGAARPRLELRSSYSRATQTVAYNDGEV